MSARTIASGSDFMCFVRSGSVGSYIYKSIAGQLGCSLQREANYRETNAKNLGGWADFFTGLKKWSASVEMEIPDYDDTNTDEINFEDLQDYEAAGTKPTFVFAWITALSATSGNPQPDTTKPIYTGQALVSCPGDFQPGENAKTSVALQGCKELTKTDPT